MKPRSEVGIVKCYIEGADIDIYFLQVACMMNHNILRSRMNDTRDIFAIPEFSMQLFFHVNIILLGQMKRFPVNYVQMFLEEIQKTKLNC